LTLVTELIKSDFYTNFTHYKPLIISYDKCYFYGFLLDFYPISGEDKCNFLMSFLLSLSFQEEAS